MLNETFYLDGIDALSAGIHLQNPIEFSEPVPMADKVSIPGRNGDLIFETGSYENRTGYAECFALLNGDVELTIRSINKFLLSKGGYRKLETSDDPEHFWMARVENGARIEQRLRTLAPFEISFDCKPQRFVKSGQEAIGIGKYGTVYNQCGFKSLPLIVVHGMGDGMFFLNDIEFNVYAMDGVLYLDSETQNAYDGNGNQNNKINAPIFPYLDSGATRVGYYGGIENMEIIPRWWEL